MRRGRQCKRPSSCRTSRNFPATSPAFVPRSEIVVPFVKDGKTRFVLDMDSDRLADFDHVDRMHLERLVAIIGNAG